MVRASISKRDAALPYQQVSVEVVVPVYIEQEALPQSILGGASAIGAASKLAF